MRETVAEVKMRKPLSKSAMAEVDFWRDRYMCLDRLSEQMQTSKRFAQARAVMKVCLVYEALNY